MNRNITLSLLLSAAAFVGLGTQTQAQDTATGQTPADIELSTADNPVYYVIKSYNRGGYLTAVGTTPQHIDVTGTGSLWRFEATADNTDGTADKGVYVYNADGQALGTGVKVSDTAIPYYLLENGVNNYGLVLSVKNPITGNDCWDANNTNTGIGAWRPTASDWEGTTWVFQKADEVADIFKTAFTTTFTTISATLDSYPTGTVPGINYDSETIAALKHKIEQEATQLDGLTTLEIAQRLTSINAINTEVANTPFKSGFLRIQSNSNNHYLTSTNYDYNDSRKDLLMEETASPASIFYFDGSKNALLGYSNGYYLVNNQNTSAARLQQTGIATDESKISKIAFVSAGEDIYEVKYATNYATNRYLYANTKDGNYFSDANSAAAAQTKFKLEAVTALPVTIGETGYATFNAPVSVSLPTDKDLKAYTATRKGDYLILSEITGTVPANTPVILQGTAADYDLTITDETATINEENVLAGTTATVAQVEGSYTLQNLSQGIGFYKYSGTEMKGFRAYLPGEIAAGAQALFFDTTTGIKGTTTPLTTAPKAIFDLSGRRVNKAGRGFYIINGQKVIVK